MAMELFELNLLCMYPPASARDSLTEPGRGWTASICGLPVRAGLQSKPGRKLLGKPW